MKTISITISVVLTLAICAAGFIMDKSGIRKNVLSVHSPLEIKTVSGNVIPDNDNNLQNSDWYSTAMNNISEMEYNITSDEKNNYVSSNRANNMRFIYNKDGFTAKTRTDKIPLFDLNDKSIKEEDKKYKILDAWSIDIKLEGLSKELQATNYESRDFSNSELKAAGNTASIENEDMRIDYTNDKKGMRQDFIIKQKPEGEGKLRVDLNAATELKMVVGADALMFKDNKGNDKMRYSSLKVWDVNGRELRAYFEKNDEFQITNDKLQIENHKSKIKTNSKSEILNSKFSIVVNDEDAVYPITIDPVSDAPDWTYDNNQANSNLGWSVAAAGDVNGDGYGDVIVGAPYFDGGQIDEGRAYVFHGSASGLSTFANWVKESDSATSAFGWSVATAGDVNGDGYSDVIIGAPFFDNGINNQGKVYVFHGSTLGLSATPDWTFKRNQADSYLGKSVSTAGDVNNDGYSDVIFSAPDFDAGQVKEGKVFIHHGSSSGLSVTTNRGLEQNVANEHYGTSVSLAGDVNGDGYSDVIVGSEFSANGQVKEGRAFIYNGSAGGTLGVPYWIGESNQVNAYLGHSVSTAGDVNGDGLSDVIVGAPNYEDDANTNEGRVFVFYGNATSMSTTADWEKDQDQVTGYFGNSVSTAGDVNGDGYADIITGGYGIDNPETDEGRAYLFFGSASGPSNTADWRGEGNQDSANYGYCVATAGDVNGDGFSDIIVGSTLYDNGQTNEGRAFLYYGYADGLRPTVNWTYEINKDFAYFGSSVSSAGDVNGDGYSDVIVGAPNYGNGENSEGGVFVFYGLASGLSNFPNWTEESNQAGAHFGWSVSSAGDVNGDGYSDVIVGANDYDNGENNEGQAFVYYGSYSGLPDSANWTKESNQANANFGSSVSSAGDVNGDGYSDIIIGSYRYDNGETNEGRAFVYYGSSSGLSTSSNWTAESNQANSYFGRSVSYAGDVNGDGYSEVIIGAEEYDNGESNEGLAFLYYGSPTGLSASADWTAESNQVGASFGNSVSSAGDLNGDGYSDVIIGAYAYDNGETNEGRAYVYYGSSTGLSFIENWTAEGNQVSAFFGNSVSAAGDVNGDGYSDVIVGAPNYGIGGIYEGRAYVYYGSSTGLSFIANWTAEGNQVNAEFGNSVSSAGDVNGDGYSDVIVGSSSFDNGQADEGKVFVYYGNRKNGLRSTVQQYKPGSNNIIGPGGNTGTDGNVKLNLFGKSPSGRSKGKIVYEHKANGLPFSGNKITYSTLSSGSGIMTDLGTSGIDLTKELSGLLSDKEYKWRARVQYDLAKNPYQKFGPWKYYANFNPVPAGGFKPSDGPLPKLLNLTMFIQGFYNSSTNLMTEDTVKVYLRNSTLPYAIVDSAMAKLSSTGAGTFLFQNASNDVNYFLHLKHRNSVETWSKTAQTFTANIMTYNFTTANTQAYGNNIIQVDASPVGFAIYGGDVTQNGIIDVGDVINIYNDAVSFISGYLVTDVTGDGLVDSSDLLLAYNNSTNFVSVIKP